MKEYFHSMIFLGGEGNLQDSGKPLNSGKNPCDQTFRYCGVLLYVYTEQFFDSLEFVYNKILLKKVFWKLIDNIFTLLLTPLYVLLSNRYVNILWNPLFRKLEWLYFLKWEDQQAGHQKSVGLFEFCSRGQKEKTWSSQCLGNSQSLNWPKRCR